MQAKPDPDQHNVYDYDHNEADTTGRAGVACGTDLSMSPPFIPTLAAP
jgi:hypothetical protein